MNLLKVSEELRKITKTGTRGNAWKHHKVSAYRMLMVAIISRAVDDLKDTGLYCSDNEADKAMNFILSKDCEVWCMELDFDYRALKKLSINLYQTKIEKGIRKRNRYRRRIQNA